MRDAGVPSRQEKSKVANRMAKSVQEKMAQWTDDNFVYYQQVMDMIREGAPVQWAKLYHEAIKLGIVKESNINITISRQQDRENLQALVRTRIPVSLPSSQPVYTPYIEIPAKEEEEP